MSVTNIILLHGLYMKPFIMHRLANKFQRAGYSVHLFGYRTHAFSLIPTLKRLDQLLESIPGEDVCLIGHSMGGLVARLYCTAKPSSKVSKVVTLGTPHLGSHLAKFVNRTAFRRLLGTAGEAGLVDTLPVWNAPVDLGCIIGDAPNVGANLILGPFHGKKGPGDGAVFVDEAWLPSATDICFVSHTHTGMLFANATFEQCLHFVRTGRFQSGSKFPSDAAFDEVKSASR